MATTAFSNNQIKEILSDAKKDVKGRYYIYERYKSMLRDVCESPAEYERAIIELARILRV